MTELDRGAGETPRGRERDLGNLATAERGRVDRDELVSSGVPVRRGRRAGQESEERFLEQLGSLLCHFGVDL